MLFILLGGMMVRFGRGKGAAPESVESKVDEKMPLLAAPVQEVRPEQKEEEQKEEGEEVLSVVKSVPVVRIQEPSPTPEDSPPRSEGTPETDQTATPPPKKKSTRRRVRGKKKKPDATAATAASLIPEEHEGENEDEDHEKDKEDVSPRPTPKGGNKPLPELPRELSSTDLLDYQDKERLAISDTIIGEST